jgi:hypothetical protein
MWTRCRCGRRYVVGWLHLEQPAGTVWIDPGGCDRCRAKPLLIEADLLAGLLVVESLYCKAM